MRYASFFWMQGACVLYEIILVRAAILMGLNVPRQLWISIGLALVRCTWVWIVLYHTIPVVQDEMTRVSRIFGLRPVYFLSLPE